MSTETLTTLIEQLQQSTPPRRKSKDPQKSKSKWNKQSQKQILELLLIYGEDLSLIHNYFPDMSRKQVRRKVREILQKRRGFILKVQDRVQRERRKSFFDQEVLDQGRSCLGGLGDL